uniref:Uncharacterized protein n=1 Tax=Arundo donax TaxID=35708 RepID=A0A0A8ZQN4_ARUDO
MVGLPGHHSNHGLPQKYYSNRKLYNLLNILVQMPL